MTLVAQMHSYGYSYTVPVKQFFENIIPPTLGKDKGFSPKAKSCRSALVAGHSPVVSPAAERTLNLVATRAT